MAAVFVIGIAVVDFVFAMDALPDRAAKYRARDAEIVGGGCAANAAVAIAKLGGTAQLGARLGDDAMGDLIIADLNVEGVDTELVQRTEDARSSFSSVFVDKDGARQIMNFRGSGLTTQTDWIANATRPQAVLADTRWADGARRALDLATDWGVPGIVDAEAPMEDTVLGAASHVAFSRDGLISVTGHDDLAQGLVEMAQQVPAWLCVTDGEHGSYHLDRGNVVHTPAFPVAVVDTLGAGDVWHGAFALALAEGQREPDAVRFANATAALKCTTFGGRKGTPTRGAVETFLKEHA